MPHLRVALDAPPAPGCPHPWPPALGRPASGRSTPGGRARACPPSWPWLLALVPSLASGGCALVDQRTFNPEAGKPPAVAAAPPAPAAAPAGPAALLTVRFDRPAAIEGPVRQAVALARARKPDVAFDVVSVVPDADAVGAGGAEAARVARLITAQGVPATRVNLQVRLDPAVGARDVRVFVR